MRYHRSKFPIQGSDDYGCERQTGDRPRQNARDMEEASGRRLEMCRGYVEFRSSRHSAVKWPDYCLDWGLRIWPVDLSRMRGRASGWEKSNIALMEPAMASKEPPPTLSPCNQLSSMKCKTEV